MMTEQIQVMFFGVSAVSGITLISIITGAMFGGLAYVAGVAIGIIIASGIGIVWEHEDSIFSNIIYQFRNKENKTTDE